VLDSAQKNIFEKIQKENRKHNVFIVTGVAGSGKTTLISELSKNKGNFDEVIVSSLTGKACQVLKNKGVADARTIQSFLYGRPRFNIKLNKKGKLKKISQAHLTLGQAHYELQNFEEAKKQFRMAARDKDKKIKKTANSWIKYTENEESRAKNLELRRNYIKQS